MNHDITHCPNTRCPQASECRRSTIHFAKFPPPHEWLSFAEFTPDPKSGRCEHFLSLDTIDLDIQTSNQGQEK